MVRFRGSALRIALIGLCVVTSVAHARAAWAQKKEPPGPFVIDVRGDFVSFAPTDPIGHPFALTKTQMPARGIGIEAGAHVYPLRFKRITIGVGGNYLTSRGNKVPDPVALPTDPTVRERFSTIGTQLSLNFGTSQGWSYIGGGIGSSRRAIQVFPVEQTKDASGKTVITQSTAPFTAEGARSKTINYGGGARWFASAHIAFGFDLRWYAINPAVATTTMPGIPRQTLFVANAGISIH
jgi:hypothetical protein